MLAPIDYTLWDQESLEGVPAEARGRTGLSYTVLRLCLLILNVPPRTAARQVRSIPGISRSFPARAVLNRIRMPSFVHCLPAVLHTRVYFL